MFWKFVVAAVKFRRRRLLLAFSSMTVAATLATTLFSIYSEIEDRVRGEFRGYGANLVIAPAKGLATVPLLAVTQAENLGARASPLLFSTAILDEHPVVLAGLDFGRSQHFTTYWRVQGARTASGDDCLAGTLAADRFNLAIGRAADLESRPCHVTGIVSTGGPEDSQLILPYDRVASRAQVFGVASLISVRADGSRLAQVRADLQSRLPGTDVRLIQAVAQTETAVVLKVRAAFFLLMLVILAITTLSVTSNFSELVLERSREIGILKAIGARERRIAALFVSESSLLALLATVAGYVIGNFVAAEIARSIFGGVFTLSAAVPVLLFVGAVTLAVAIVATMFAAARIWRIEPALILRGD